MLIDSGTILIKFWLHVSAERQEERFQDRAHDPRKRWKLSPIDIEGRNRWIEFTKYRDKMFDHTSTNAAPWLVVDANDKRKARLNIIRAILDRVPYEFNEAAFKEFDLPPRPEGTGEYQEPELSDLNLIKDYFSDD